MDYETRWPKAPWLYLLSDLRAQGLPEHQTFVGGSVILGLHVRGLADRAAILGVRIREDGSLSAAVVPQGNDDADL